MDIDHFAKTIVGICAPTLGVITSYQEQIEWHLRVSSLAIGVLVGALSLASIVRKLLRDR
jgi:hypothetical protein